MTPRRFAFLLLFSIALITATLTAQMPSRPATSAASDNDALLAHAAELYYSAVRPAPAHAILDSFQCAVHPEWPGLLAAVDKSSGSSTAQSYTVAPSDPRLELLTPITVSVRTEINGAATLNWNQPSDSGKPLDQASADLLDRVHQTTAQELEGFFRFWITFINGTIIPKTSKGIEVRHSVAGVTLHAEMRDQKLDEIFSPDWTLKEFNVSMGGVSIRFTPTFDSTSEGLLVKTFDAYIQPPATESAQARRMQVALDYQTVNGFQLPSHLDIAVTGAGRVAFIFTGCTVQGVTQ